MALVTLCYREVDFEKINHANRLSFGSLVPGYLLPGE